MDSDSVSWQRTYAVRYVTFCKMGTNKRIQLTSCGIKTKMQMNHLLGAEHCDAEPELRKVPATQPYNINKLKIFTLHHSSQTQQLSTCLIHHL
jgi:hypothetical protein